MIGSANLEIVAWGKSDSLRPGSPLFANGGEAPLQDNATQDQEGCHKTRCPELRY